MWSSLRFSPLEDDDEKSFPGIPHLVPFEGNQIGQFLNCMLLNSPSYSLVSVISNSASYTTII